MKRTGLLVLVMLIAVAATRAQDTSAPVLNPVSTTVKAQLPRFSKNMVAAAESMPAEKYGFKLTPEMNSFGHLDPYFSAGMEKYGFKPTPEMNSFGHLVI